MNTTDTARALVDVWETANAVTAAFDAWHHGDTLAALDQAITELNTALNEHSEAYERALTPSRSVT